MPRPSKDYKIKRNGNSVQVFFNEFYVGSVTLPRLCEMIKKDKEGRTNGD